MATSLLTLGPFSFEGLESPERIHIKTKQRLVVHHLGSGATTIDYLGDDYETVSFSGIFSGKSAADRIRSIDYLRASGSPVVMAWSTKTLAVIIRQFELDYTSDRWIPYRVSCYVVRSINTAIADLSDIISLSPGAQVNDIVGLLRYTNITPSFYQISALTTLARLDFDTPPPVALEQARNLADSITDQVVLQATQAQTVVALNRELQMSLVSSVATLVTNYGQQGALILGRSRVIAIIASAEDFIRN